MLKIFYEQAAAATTTLYSSRRKTGLKQDSKKHDGQTYTDRLYAAAEYSQLPASLRAASP